MLAQSFLQLTLIAADAAAPTSHQGMLTQLFLKLTLVGAEWVLWLLVLLSFVSVGIIVDRIWYFAEHRVDVADLAAKLEQFLRARRSQKRLATGGRLGRGRMCGRGRWPGRCRSRDFGMQRGDAQCPGTDPFAARSAVGNFGNHWRQCTVYRTAGNRAGDREGRSRYVAKLVAGRRPECRHVRRVRGVGGDGRGTLRGNPRRGGVQFAPAARAHNQCPDRLAGTFGAVEPPRGAKLATGGNSIKVN